MKGVFSSLLVWPGTRLWYVKISHDYEIAWYYIWYEWILACCDVDDTDVLMVQAHSFYTIIQDKQTHMPAFYFTQNKQQLYSTDGNCTKELI